MTSIVFAFGVDHPMQLAVQFARKKYLAQEPVVVWADRLEDLQSFDALLWSEDCGSFIPHVWADDIQAPHTPIILSHTDQAVPHHHWLLNLSQGWSPIYARFQKVFEIVGTSTEDTLKGREKWMFYQSCGYSLQSHDMRSKK